MIAIIDYGMGNLRSVQKALEYLGFSAQLTNDKNQLNKADKIILPGVGAFAQAMQNLKKLDLLPALQNIFKKDKPFLGICLGMQLLLGSSEEHGEIQGLDIIAGQVKHFRSSPKFKKNLVVPHMGWNDLNIVRKNKLFADLPAKAQVYFVHSYYAAPKNKKVIIGETNYSFNFCSALQQKNIYGVQFHPEKSGEVGLQILKNFIKNI